MLVKCDFLFPLLYSAFQFTKKKYHLDALMMLLQADLWTEAVGDMPDSNSYTDSEIATLVYGSGY